MSELGQLLKRTREEKKISLEDVQKETKIQRRYLEAIEQGNFDILPGHFYVRAFVKSYAEAVGLDPDYIFREYKQELPEQPRTETAAPVQRRSRAAKPPGRLGRVLPRVLLISFIVLILYVIYFAVSNSQIPSAEDPGQGEQETSPITDIPEVDENTGEQPAEGGGSPAQPEPEPEPEPQPAEPTPQLTFVKQENETYLYELSGADSIQLAISAVRGNSWMQIRDGKEGKVLYDKTMQKGESQTWQIAAPGEAWIWMGGAPSLDITVNGQPIDTAQLRTGRQIIWIQPK